MPYSLLVEGVSVKSRKHSVLWSLFSQASPARQRPSPNAARLPNKRSVICSLVIGKNSVSTAQRPPRYCKAHWVGHRSAMLAFERDVASCHTCSRRTAGKNKCQGRVHILLCDGSWKRSSSIGSYITSPLCRTKVFGNFALQR